MSRLVKEVIAGSPLPGYQPGKWRLNLGYCAVGALALARSPRYAKSKAGSEGGGRKAEIVELAGSKFGRNRNRVRRQYRECHQAVISKDRDLVIATWNTQGCNWSRTEERHVSKLKCLVEEMRTKKVDIMCLSDLHGQLDDGIGIDSRFTSCMVEEFILIQCGRVGWFLTPAAAKGWDGKTKCWDVGGRIATIEVSFDGCHLRLGAVYMPTGYSAATTEERKLCLEIIAEAGKDVTDGGCAIFGGDWNSHIGRDGVDGRQAMLQGSTAGGKQMLQWLKKDVPKQLDIADLHIPGRSRGTWGNPQTGVWYELDYFVVSKSYVGRFGGLKTWAIGESDHAARSLRFRLAGIPKEKTPIKKQRFENKPRGFDTSKLNELEYGAKYARAVATHIQGKNTWQEVSQGVCRAAEEVLGRKQRPGADPMSKGDADAIRRAKAHTQSLFNEARTCGDPVVAKQKLKESRIASREHRALVRRASQKQWDGVIQRLEKADMTNDQTTFWKEMRNLKMYGAPAAQTIRFTPEDLRSHFSKISEQENVAQQSLLDRIATATPVDVDLDRVPDAEEIWGNLKGMKENAPGPDQVTVKMILGGGEAMYNFLVPMIQKCWQTDPNQWEECVHEADVIALPKKGDRTKLDNYRGICLLQVVSRLLARIAAKRISAHVEKHNVISNGQWGFRPYRSAIDALFVMSRLTADAGLSVDPDPLVLDFMDIQKAYPNCSRNALEKSLELAGIPPASRK